MKHGFLLFLCITLFSCDFLDTTPLRILDFSPSAPKGTPEEMEEVWITFSRRPHLVSTEEGFSFSAGGIPLEGRFSWEKNTLFFHPYVKGKPGTDYEILLSAGGGEDVGGRSLARDFRYEITTKTERVRPRVVEVSPQNTRKIDQLRPLISLTFSEGMDPGSTVDSFRIKPSAEGFLDWDEEQRVYSYVLTKDLVWQTEYTLSLDTTVKDLQNNSLGEQWESRFFLGTDSEKPALLSLTDGQGGWTNIQEDTLNSDSPVINTQGKRESSFVLLFSEAMEPLSFLGSVTISPGISWEESWDDSGRELTLVPQAELTWDTLYTLEVNQNLKDLQGNPLSQDHRFHFKVDNPESRPPEPVALILYTDPGDTSRFQVLHPYDSLDLAAFASPVPGSITEGNTVMDLFFNLGEGTGAHLISLADSFLISSRGTKSFLLLGLALEDPEFNPALFPADPLDPADPGVPYDSWARFLVYIDNDDGNKTGITTFTITNNFQDERGRKAEEAWTVPVQITN